MELHKIFSIIASVIAFFAFVATLFGWWNIPGKMKMLLQLPSEAERLVHKMESLYTSREELDTRVKILCSDERKRVKKGVTVWFRNVDKLIQKFENLLSERTFRDQVDPHVLLLQCSVYENLLSELRKRQRKGVKDPLPEGTVQDQVGDKFQCSINNISDDSIQNKLNGTQSSWFFGKWNIAMSVKKYLNEAEELENKYKDLAEADDLSMEVSEKGVILESIERKANSLKEKKTELTNIKESINPYLMDYLPEDWLQNVVSFLESSSNALKDYQPETKCKKGPFPCENCEDCEGLYTVGKKIEEILQTAERLYKEANEYRMAAEKKVDVVFIPISSSEVVGQDDKLQEVLELIKEDGSVAICGMGGVGKTTLLSRINNHYDGKNVGSASFDIVIFATAGREPSCISRVQADICKSLRIEFSESGDINKRSREIYASLRSKNCLLLVDDVWEKIEPNILGMLVKNDDNNNKRHVVVITTRDERFLQCRQKKTVKVELLSEELSWNLFCDHVKNKDEPLPLGDEEIRRLAQDIVNKCGRLPLALRTVGKSLSGARNKTAWRVARGKLVNSAHTFKDMEDEVFVPLKFSFERLEDNHMQNILFFCMSYGKISTENLLKQLLWESKQDVGDESHFKEECLDHISNLVQKGLLMCSRKVEEIDSSSWECVWLHDCVRDMLVWLIDSDKDNYLEMVSYHYNYLEMVSYHYNRSEEKKRCYLPHTEKWERAGRIKMITFPWKEFPEDIRIPDCKKLFSFVAKGCSLVRLPVNFFHSMQSLRLLELSYSSMEELPESICSLINLRCLNLSCSSHLKKLPKEMQQLEQLVYLFLRSTPNLKDIPRECFSRLHKLQELDMYGCAFEWTWDSDKQQASLHDIRKLIEYGVLRKTYVDLKVDKVGIMKTVVDSPQLLRGIGNLTVDFRNFGQVKEEISLLIENMRKMESLVTLTLKCIVEDSLLDFEGSSPPKDLPIQRLTIEDCPKLNYIANKSWKFPYLEKVVIEKCPELKHLPINVQNAPRFNHLVVNGEFLRKEDFIHQVEEKNGKKKMMRIVGEKSMLMKKEDIAEWLYFLRKTEECNEIMYGKVKILKRLEEKRKMEHADGSCSERAKEWLQNVESFIDCTSTVLNLDGHIFVVPEDIDGVSECEVFLPRNYEDFFLENGKLLLQFYQEVFAQHRRLIVEEGRMQLESRDEMLHIEPLEIRFPFELHKKSSCSLEFSNKTNTKIRFRVQPPTTIRNRYGIQPDSWTTIEPGSKKDVEVTMEALMKVPVDLLQCNDEFMVQSSIVNDDDQLSMLTQEKHILPVTYDMTSLDICDSYYPIIFDLLLQYHWIVNHSLIAFLVLPFGVVDCWAMMKILAEDHPETLGEIEVLKLDFRKLGEGKEDINLLANIMVNMESLSYMVLEYIEDQHFHLLFQGSFPPKLEHVTISNACGDHISLAAWKLFPDVTVQECENLTTLLISGSEDIYSLVIKDCPKLKSITMPQSSQFPELCCVEINRCPELKDVPFTRQNAPMLKWTILNGTYISNL